MTDPTSDNARSNFRTIKVFVLSAALGALAILITLLYFFPFQTGIVLGILGFSSYLIASSAPTVKKTTSHTTTIKRG